MFNTVLFLYLFCIWYHVLCNPGPDGPLAPSCALMLHPLPLCFFSLHAFDPSLLIIKSKCLYTYFTSFGSLALA